MNETEIVALIQKSITEAMQEGGVSRFSELYPYFVVGLLSYLLGRVNALHQDLREYFKLVGSHLADIKDLLRR